MVNVLHTWLKLNQVLTTNSSWYNHANKQRVNKCIYIYIYIYVYIYTYVVYVYICLHMWFMYTCNINMVNILVNGTTMLIYIIYTWSLYLVNIWFVYG